MDVGDVIALISVAVACFALWEASQSRSEATKANTIADEVRKEAARANEMASTSNALSRHSNVIAEKSLVEAKDATKIANESLSHSKDVALKQFSAQLELNFEKFSIESGGEIVIDYRLINIGLSAASSFVALWQHENIEDFYHYPENWPTRIEPGESVVCTVSITAKSYPAIPGEPFIQIPTIQIMAMYTDLTKRRWSNFVVSYEFWRPTTVAIADDGLNRYPHPILPNITTPPPNPA
jgi:hypothetical protein